MKKKNSLIELAKKIKENLWFKYVIKEDEFHESLDLDHRKMINMPKEKRDEYLKEIVRKRNLAHELDIKNSK